MIILFGLLIRKLYQELNGDIEARGPVIYYFFRNFHFRSEKFQPLTGFEPNSSTLGGFCNCEKNYLLINKFNFSKDKNKYLIDSLVLHKKRNEIGKIIFNN